MPQSWGLFFLSGRPFAASPLNRRLNKAQRLRAALRKVIELKLLTSLGG
ncbi:hypothetical protein BACCAP_00370 [Pseudoflavonifractor capillosus ATCC 29799]|uniref:Uncharacterized protein n=1 Tax=Pseudoflavonifractor capillosus ATCC 29799 TaxID=411467 RepID=A6NQA0_9FIRM|nr:hypothetical protein BACCAP_00370 [Pseudoflavonifractor capillosus ATCC 29799]